MNHTQSRGTALVTGDRSVILLRMRDSKVMKSIVWFVSTKEVAQWLALITLLGVAPIASIAADSPRGCDPGGTAAAYDRKADEYEAAADERYRAWASAHVATDQDGSVWGLAEEVARLDAAAKESRARAAESRSRGQLTASVDGCGPQEAAGVSVYRLFRWGHARK